VQETEVKCLNDINKNRDFKYQCCKDSGAVPKNLRFIYRLSSGALGYNNQCLFDKRGRFALVINSP
jgi:hypothetical protein